MNLYPEIIEMLSGNDVLLPTTGTSDYSARVRSNNVWDGGNALTVLPTTFTTCSTVNFKMLVAMLWINYMLS